MKLARPLLVTLGVLAVACAAGLALALTPSVQRWALLRMAADHPGLKLEVTEISARFSSLTLRGVHVEKNGLRVQVGQLAADYSPWQLLFNHRLQIQRFSADGILVDASRLTRARTGAAAAGAPVAAPSLLAQLELPVELVLEDCHVVGRVLLPGAAGKPPLAAGCKITGGRFAPGQEGSLLLVATVRNPAADAPVTALHAQISLRAVQTGQRNFSRVALTAVVDAEGKSFSGQNQLKISAELKRDSAGEDYSVSIDTLSGGAAENLLAAQAMLAAGQKEYAGRWVLKARTAQLEPFVLDGALPDFAASGDGRFTFVPFTQAVSLQGRIEAAASRLEAIEPSWRAIGPVRLQAQFDLALADGVASLRQLVVRIAGAEPVFELQATRAAEFNFKESRLRVGGSIAGEVMNLKLHGLPLAWVRPFIGIADVSGGMITGEFRVTAEQDRLLLHAVQPLRVDRLTVIRDGEMLLANAAAGLDAEAVLTARELRASVGALSLHTLAGDSLNAQGTVAMPLPLKRSCEVSASYDANLPTLLALWLPLGPVKAKGAAEFTVTGNKIEFHRFDASLSNPGDVAMFKAEALRPFSFDLATWRATSPANGATELARITLAHVPLDHLSLDQPGSALTGEVERGEFVLIADGDKLGLRAVSPFILAGVSLSQDGRPALRELAVEAMPEFELTGRSSSSGQTGDITVRNAAGAALLTGKAGVTQSTATGLSGTLTFNLDLPALTSQPLFARTQAVAQGRASGEIRLAVGSTRQVEARLTVNGLVARDGGQTLPVANLSFRGIVQENGKITVQAPLLLDRAGQRSDLNFSLDLTPAGRGFTLDGRLTGAHVELADALSILGVFLPTAAGVDQPAAQTAQPANVTADTVPAWARFNGQLLLDIKSATSGKDWAMTGLTGLVVISPAQFSLQKLEAAFGEKSRFGAKGELNFTDAPQPYQLTGDFSLTEFDAGRFFKALEPARPATVEGLFTVSGHFDGRGATVEQTINQSRGRFELASRQGIFRGLQRTTSRVSMTSKAVELGATVFGSIFGSEKVTKVAEKVAGQAYFVDQLAQSVGELNYDQLNVRLVRDETLNVSLEDFSLVSPEIRLAGKGTVTYVMDKPLLEQPLNASLAVAGRGKIEQLLGKLRLLDGTRDELGYARSQAPVTVAGTLARPDPTSFFTKVATSKLNELLAPDD